MAITRFIPTRVGNTIPSCASILSAAVHPHASGEHSPHLCASRHAIGSSPREWGTRHVCLADEIDQRFIPTRVGNTSQSSKKHPCNAVHPHASGEHLILAVFDTAFMRFIPTRVGNTVAVFERLRRSAVHPHASGEHRVVYSSAASFSGSSPREWGTPLLFRRLK